MHLLGQILETWDLARGIVARFRPCFAMRRYSSARSRARGRLTSSVLPSAGVLHKFLCQLAREPQIHTTFYSTQ